MCNFRPGSASDEDGGDVVWMIAEGRKKRRARKVKRLSRDDLAVAVASGREDGLGRNRPRWNY